MIKTKEINVPETRDMNYSVLKTLADIIQRSYLLETDADRLAEESITLLVPEVKYHSFYLNEYNMGKKIYSERNLRG